MHAPAIELVVRGTLVYWLLVIVADAAQNAMSGLSYRFKLVRQFTSRGG